MKRTIWLGLGLAVVVGGAWFGRAAWRAHKNLVSLDVRNMPLREVVRNIEWQTWEKIHLDKRLDGLVTLKLKNTPLAEALDGLAEEVGARAETLHAVYRSDYALVRLKRALTGGENISAVDWTNLAPRLAGGTPSAGAPNGAGGGFSGAELEQQVRQQLAAKGLDKQIPEGAIAATLDRELSRAMQGGGTVVVGSPKVMVITNGTDDPNLPPGIRAALSKTGERGALGGSIHAGPDGAVIEQSGPIGMSPVVRVMKPGPDGTMEVEDWSPERIVIETALDEKFSPESSISPTRQAAEQAARKAKARCTTLYALEKSDLPGTVLRGLRGEPGVLLQGTNGQPLDPAAMSGRLVQSLKREKAEQYQKLTPEQRALRARQVRLLQAPANPNP